MTIDFKIDETRINLGLSLSNTSDPKQFNVHFSAFTTSARSVIQYVFTACEAKKQKNWYRANSKRFDTFKLFKKIRDQNVHEAIFFPGCRLQVTQSANIATTSILSFEIRDAGGKLVTAHREEPKPHDIPQSETAVAEYTVKVNGRDQELLPLCQRYMIQITEFVLLAKQQAIV